MGGITPEQWTKMLSATKTGERFNRVGMLDPMLSKAGLPETGRNASLASRTGDPERVGPSALGIPGRLPSVEDMFTFYLDFLKNRLGARFPGNPFPGLEPPVMAAPVTPQDFVPLGDRGR
jgi:hypothetical protein